MKNLALITLTAIALQFSACKEKDPCEETICASGSCIDGKCECPLLIDGEQCDNMVLEKYAGRYIVTTEEYNSKDSMLDISIDTMNLLVTDIQEIACTGRFTFYLNGFYQLGDRTYSFTDLDKYTVFGISDTFAESQSYLNGIGKINQDQSFEEVDSVYYRWNIDDPYSLVLYLKVKSEKIE
jgi:hypothetical protein